MNCLKITRTLGLSWTISMWPKSTHSAHACPALLKATQDAKSSPGNCVCLLGCSAWSSPPRPVRGFKVMASTRNGCQRSRTSTLGLWQRCPTLTHRELAGKWSMDVGRPQRSAGQGVASPKSHPTSPGSPVPTDLVRTFCPFSPVPPVKGWFPCTPNAEIVSAGIGQLT